MQCRRLNIFKILGILLEFFENSLDFLRGFFVELIVNFLGIVNDCLHFQQLIGLLLLQSYLIVYILKVGRLFTFSKSADFLHFKCQLITKSYLNMEGIDLNVKILAFAKILSQWRRKKKFQSRESS